MLHVVLWVWKSDDTFQESVLVFDLLRAGSPLLLVIVAPGASDQSLSSVFYLYCSARITDVHHSIYRCF